MSKKKVIGWIIIAVAVIIAFIVVARDAIFGGAPFGGIDFIGYFIACGATVVSYFIATQADKSRK